MSQGGDEDELRATAGKVGIFYSHSLSLSRGNLLPSKRSKSNSGKGNSPVCSIYVSQHFVFGIEFNTRQFVLPQRSRAEKQSFRQLTWFRLVCEYLTNVQRRRLVATRSCPMPFSPFGICHLTATAAASFVFNMTSE